MDTVEDTAAGKAINCLVKAPFFLAKLLNSRAFLIEKFVKF